jgi:hypothetical protein
MLAYYFMWIIVVPMLSMFSHDDSSCFFLMLVLKLLPMLAFGCLIIPASDLRC